jgi:hypothetical protein
MLPKKMHRFRELSINLDRVLTITIITNQSSCEDFMSENKLLASNDNRAVCQQEIVNSFLS